MSEADVLRGMRLLLGHGFVEHGFVMTTTVEFDHDKRDYVIVLQFNDGRQQRFNTYFSLLTFLDSD